MWHSCDYNTAKTVCTCIYNHTSYILLITTWQCQIENPRLVPYINSISIHYVQGCATPGTALCATPEWKTTKGKCQRVQCGVRGPKLCTRFQILSKIFNQDFNSDLKYLSIYLQDFIRF